MLLKSLFPSAVFSAPASPSSILRTEQSLGARLPKQLSDLYLECDGFREPIGNAKYLLSLETEDFAGSLLSTTRFWWREWPKIAPHGPDFSNYIFFGMSSGGEVWGIRLNTPFEIIAYHHNMEDVIEVVGTNILEVFVADFASYPSKA